jgi:DNA-directed RNA polymerase I subunit RPA34.5
MKPPNQANKLNTPAQKPASRTKMPSKTYLSKELVSDSDESDEPKLAGSKKSSRAIKDAELRKRTPELKVDSASNTGTDSIEEESASEVESPQQKAYVETKRYVEDKRRATPGSEDAEVEEAEETTGEDSEVGDSENDSEQEQDQDSSQPETTTIASQGTKGPLFKNGSAIAVDDIRPVTLFTPPTGFGRIKLDKRVSVATQFTNANLDGKEIWHIAVPAGTSMEEFQQASLGGIARGEPVFETRGMQYGLSPQSDEVGNATIMLPEKHGYCSSKSYLSVFVAC